MWTEQDAAAAAADGWQIKHVSIVPLGNKYPSRGAALQHVYDLRRGEEIESVGDGGGLRRTGKQGLGCRALKHIDNLKLKLRMKQFPEVVGYFGAPMGRWTGGNPLDQPCRLFKVKMFDGGYDDGGAYWGSPNDLYCLQAEPGEENDEVQHFVRAGSRIKAFFKLREMFPGLRLRNPIPPAEVAEFEEDIKTGRREPNGDRVRSYA